VSNPATAVFAHGGWHDGWSGHLVRELLDARGVSSVALDLPIEWPSSQSPFLLHPDLVADLVAQRAASAPG
jgi:hypothetical protein